jgi:hypothetical protein
MALHRRHSKRFFGAGAAALAVPVMLAVFPPCHFLDLSVHLSGGTVAGDHSTSEGESLMPARLHGRTALVTGSTDGIGAASAVSDEASGIHGATLSVDGGLSVV